jgi:hypothetical protein
MIRRAKWFILTAALAVVALLAGGASSLDSSLRAQTPKSAAKKTAAKKPSKKKAAQHLFKVQARGAKRVFAFSNKPSAQTAALALKRQGWSAKVKARKGQAIVQAKMNRWQTRAIVTTRPLANRVASILRAQHLQTRIRQIK